MKDINSIQSGLVKENDVNTPSVQTYRGKNQFPQSFQHPSTCMYGYVDPVAVAKGEIGDVIPYKFVTDLNTFTMKSPLKSQVKMYSAAFKVPMESLYPRTYDFLFSFAQKGDEVPQDRPTSNGVETSARAIFDPLEFLTSCTNIIALSYEEAANGSYAWSNYIRTIFLLESVFSAGSLFSKMNIHLNSYLFPFTNTTRSIPSLSFDKFIDNHFYPLFSELIDTVPCYLVHYSYESDVPEYSPIFCITNDSRYFNTRVGSDSGYINFDDDAYYCSIDRAFELLRTGDWIFKIDSFSRNYDRLSDLAESFFVNPDITKIRTSTTFPRAINIEPIIAYQQSCIHFFNNPKVDYLYTVDLWRDNLNSILYDSGCLSNFDYNGTFIFYDVTSQVHIKKICHLVDDYDSELFYSFFNYFFHLFSFHRSLRYGDYFTGARPEPIGVGDITLDEDASGISSLEVARKLQLTRLLNKVAITGPEHSQQVKYIFGGRLPDVPKDVPIRLSLEEFDIEGFETNNTGEAQLSNNSPNITTTNLRLTDSKFMFEVQIDEPCWLVVVQFFEAHRIYSNTIDRFAYHYDLYDDFVPDMQFIGDQDVKQSELLGVYGEQFSPFAYHLRNMEYKQRVSYASGGFIEFLKSWAFITDNADGNPPYKHITPEYIRSSPSEFDRFYKSLLGHSLASRFHFITFNTNVIAPYRQMVYAPEILA